jgi:hypothetical protein
MTPQAELPAAGCDIGDPIASEIRRLTDPDLLPREFQDGDCPGRAALPGLSRLADAREIKQLYQLYECRRHFYNEVRLPEVEILIAATTLANEYKAGAQTNRSRLPDTV